MSTVPRTEVRPPGSSGEDGSEREEAVLDATEENKALVTSVAGLSRARLGGREMAVIDLFRAERGLLVEPRDVMEEILPKESWVNGGKF